MMKRLQLKLIEIKIGNVIIDTFYKRSFLIAHKSRRGIEKKFNGMWKNKIQSLIETNWSLGPLEEEKVFSLLFESKRQKDF
jgi:hypothetical protein